MPLFLSSLLDPTLTAPAGGIRRWVPAMDLVETETHAILTVDLPGMKGEDIAIECDGETLSISGARPAAEPAEGTRRLRRERVTGSFRRTVTLPEGVDADAVEAAYADGVLEVRIPRPEQRRPRRVQIAVGDRPALVEA